MTTGARTVEFEDPHPSLLRATGRIWLVMRNGSPVAGAAMEPTAPWAIDAGDQTS